MSNLEKLGLFLLFIGNVARQPIDLGAVFIMIVGFVLLLVGKERD